jgi:hypothetical protein
MTPDVQWRVDAMRRQVPPFPRPIPFLVAVQGCKVQRGHCLSCGEPLEVVETPGLPRVRCDACTEAAQLVMREVGR